MSQKRKVYSPKLRSQVALAAVRGDQGFRITGKGPIRRTGNPRHFFLPAPCRGLEGSPRSSTIQAF